MVNIDECIIIKEVAVEDYDALAKALNYLDTRTWGFIPYSEIYDDGATVQAECCMDERGDIDQIEDYLDGFGFHYYIEYI
tara:strand:- start:253 stop:492 length:240 start_codon:yes stop_codon:yes gene_type:complete